MVKRYKLFPSEEKLKTAIPLGTKKMLRIGERRICVFHHESGYKVFDNLCPHSGHSLLEGQINAFNEIVCPLHGYRFSLLDGRECEMRTQDLQLHKLEVSEGGAFLLLID